jgi:hypothetical protein
VHLQPTAKLFRQRGRGDAGGLLRHLTSAEIDRNYVDTHGASVIGFAFPDLLGFRLLPRLKNIGSLGCTARTTSLPPPGLRRC